MRGDSDRCITKDDLDECVCCDGLHDSVGMLCPGCSEAGCSRFSGECESDHIPVIPDGGHSDEQGDALGSGPVILSKDRADALRQEIRRNSETMDSMVEEYRELEAENERLKRRLWAAKWIRPIVGALVGGGLVYVL